ncbi:response regulator [Candidatus Pacearchaeota archaeon]|nr:response regulator [Candidatus Pacearchaeota archaeon]
MKMKILVVDDDEVLRNELSEWLNREGHDTRSADSGEKAVEMVKSQDFNMVLTDLKMPGLDGLNVLKKVKELRPSAHTVMITAYGAVDTAVEAMKIGADDYICKPFEDDQLHAILENTVNAIKLERQLKALKTTEELEFKDPFEFLKHVIRDGKGLCITQRNPREIKTRYGFQNVKVLWLTTEESSGSCIHPRDVYLVNNHIESFLVENPNGFILLDGIETLIRHHSWNDIKKFISNLSGSSLLESSTMMISIKTDQVDESILSELQHLITNPYIQLISESLSNPIRRAVVRYISSHGISRFSDILAGLNLDSAPKLSFHLIKLLSDGILQKADDKKYALTNRGKSATEYLMTLEKEVTNDARNNISLIFSS